MKPACNVATLIERYFTDRLMRQRNVSPNTIASYRDTFRLLFTFAQARLRKSPSDLALGDLDAPFIGAFLIASGCAITMIAKTALDRVGIISEWCRGSHAAAADRSPSRLRRNGEARWRGCAGRYGRRGVRSP